MFQNLFLPGGGLLTFTQSPRTRGLCSAPTAHSAFNLFVLVSVYDGRLEGRRCFGVTLRNTKRNIVPPAGGCVSHGRRCFHGERSVPTVLIMHTFPSGAFRVFRRTLYVAVDKHSVSPEVQHVGNSELS